jgi:hypothetical protein
LGAGAPDEEKAVSAIVMSSPKGDKSPEIAFIITQAGARVRGLIGPDLLKQL